MGNRIGEKHFDRGPLPVLRRAWTSTGRKGAATEAHAHYPTMKMWLRGQRPDCLSGRGSGRRLAGTLLAGNRSAKLTMCPRANTTSTKPVVASPRGCQLHKHRHAGSRCMAGGVDAAATPVTKAWACRREQRPRSLIRGMGALSLLVLAGCLLPVELFGQIRFPTFSALPAVAWRMEST
ncbi:hypothetical protein B0T10DRAFT_93036 [Thelonectria olida]|uniref:Uncharacterized protein n=1 Tax=Thelonectria olida TaxID=1576542 RepID=A0A9P8VYQ1_9HYPO|nr:hypothetical protein B0T10DRAFT_93036 [Thelonectria olida]